jgi:MFS family permease
MFSTFSRISSLLFGAALLFMGIGLLGTTVAVRARLAGFSEPVVGVVMAAYFLGFVGGTYLCPPLIRQVGHIRAFAAMASVASGVAVAHALWVHPAPWFVLRVVNGACAVGMYMVMESWLNVLAPNERRATLLGVYSAISLFAMGGSQFLLLASDARDFVLFGAAAVLLSLCLVPVALTRVAEPDPVAAIRVSMGEIWRQSPMGVYGAGAAGLVNGAFWGMGAVFAHQVGIAPGVSAAGHPNAGVALFMGTTVLGGAVLQWPLGRLSDRHDRRRVLALACAAGAALAVLALLASGRSPALVSALCFAYGGVAFTMYSMSVAHVNDFAAGRAALHAAQGMLLVYGVGATIGPAVAGALMHLYGPGALLALFALTLLSVTAFALYRMTRRAPVPVENQAPYVALLRTSQAAMRMDPRLETDVATEAPGGDGPPPPTA